MGSDIQHRCYNGTPIDFILATGDLAFSGKSSEYDLVQDFFNKVSAASGVGIERIFCIPGNHDVDRNRQTTLFMGARSTLKSHSQVYSFLEKTEERETLLKRLENYKQFQELYFSGQQRKLTDDQLGYVSTIDVGDVRIAILGLNSAWLADGGTSDHMNLLLGESQARDALRLANAANPHITLAMGHHPLRLLQDFDRSSLQSLIEHGCHFFHCGHLHEPEAYGTIDGKCLTLAAGASFDSREYQNAYSIVSLDLLHAKRDVKFIRYNPVDGLFSYEKDSSYNVEVDATKLCGIGELATVLEKYTPSGTCPYYLSALLLGMQAEVPIASGNIFVFGAVGLITNQPDTDFNAKTKAFLACRNILRLFSGRMELRAILAKYGHSIREYSDALGGFCNADEVLRDKVAERERNARALANVEPLRPFQHTHALLDRLRAEEDWDELRRQARRHIDSSDTATALTARRMLGICLGRSSERSDQEEAIKIHRALQSEGIAEAQDIAVLADVLIALKDYDLARDVIRSGLRDYPDRWQGFAEIGNRITEATGDRNFRDELSALCGQKGKHCDR